MTHVDNHIELNPKDPKDLAAGAAAVGAMGYAVYDNVKARRKRNQVRSSLSEAQQITDRLQKKVDAKYERLNAYRERTQNTQKLVKTMGNQISNIQKSAVAAFDAYDKGPSKGPVSPPAANENRYNAGNVRSMKPPPQSETHQSIKKKLTSARDVANTMHRTVVDPTIKALRDGNYAAIRGTDVPVPKPQNQNKVKTMGGRGGGWFVNPTGLLGKATDKWFKKV